MKRRNRGFTLIELMLSITILAVLLGLGVPAFRNFTRDNSVTASQNDLVTAMNLARSEALRRNRPVSVCASTDGETCGSASQWSSGWIAFTDTGTAGTVDGTDAVLHTWQAGVANLTFSAGSTAFAQFLPTGMSASASAVTIDIAYSGCTGQHKRRVVVGVNGALTGQLVACP